MLTLKDLTPEIEAKIPTYHAHAIEKLYNGEEHAAWKFENTLEYVQYVYKLANQSAPFVFVANTPKEYSFMYDVLFNSTFFEDFFADIDDPQFDRNQNDLIYEKLNAIVTTRLESNEQKPKSNYHFITEMSEHARVYLMWFKFIMTEFKLECEKAEELNWLYDKINGANIAKGYFTKYIALILRMPKTIKRNEIGFHCTKNESAIEYEGENLFYINGRRVPDWVFEKYFSKTLTFNDFLNEENEDIKAAIITLIEENEGPEGVLNFLNAQEIDKQTLVHKSGHIEEITLYKTKEKYSFLQDHNGIMNQPYAWTRFVCPSTEQVYLIATSAAFDNALDSAKFHRPSAVPAELLYNFSQFNN